MITVTLDEVEGLEPYILIARLHGAGDEPVGETHYFGAVPWFTDTFVPGSGRISVSPYSAADNIHPIVDGKGVPDSGEILGVPAGEYRLVVEAL